MSTSAEQINTLIGGYTDLKTYFEGQRNDWDMRVAAAENQVDTFLTDARSEFPAVNLLKNATARDTDNDGNFVSPISMYVGAQSTVLSYRIVPPDHADVPAEMAALVPISSTTVWFNMIEVTMSQNGGTGYFLFLPSRPIRGLVSAGCLAVFAEHEGIEFVGQNLPAGELVRDINQTANKNWHIDMLRGTVTGENKKMWIVGPWVAAGKVKGSPLFILNDNMHLNSNA